MWARIDDDAPDHPKFATAGDLLGPDGSSVAFGFWMRGVCYSNKRLTDGLLPAGVVRTWSPRASKIASALVSAGLWEVVEGGYRIHDYHDYNPRADEVRAKLEADRRRKENERRKSLGLPPIPAGVQTDSKRNPKGLQSESARIPEPPARAGAGPRGCVPSRPVPSSTPSPLTPPPAGEGNSVRADVCAICGSTAAQLGYQLEGDVIGDQSIAVCRVCMDVRQGRSFTTLDAARAWTQRALWASNRRRYVEHRAIAFGGRPPTEAPPALPGPAQASTWAQVLERLRAKVDRRKFFDWFKPLHLVEETGAAITVRAPSDEHARYLQKHYRQQIDEAGREVSEWLSIEVVGPSDDDTGDVLGRVVDFAQKGA